MASNDMQKTNPLYIFKKKTTWYVIGGVILTSVLIASLTKSSGVSVESVEH